MLIDSPGAQPENMRPRDFDALRKVVHDFCGVDLRGKEILVGSRLRGTVHQLGFPSLEAYLGEVTKNPGSELFAGMIDLLTTNHTSFFRERQHFDLLCEVVVPGIPERDPIRIWSAACSSGEEPYTILFSLYEKLGEALFSRAEILATDISTRVLAKAEKGLYANQSLERVPLPTRRRCLLKGTGTYADQCLVKRELRDLVTFKQFNLLESCSSHGMFQVIFCRNVMIYFDQATQEALVNRLAAQLAPGGYLLIGHSESLGGVKQPLHFVAPATYRKAGGAKAGEHSGQGMTRRRTP